MGSEDEKGYLKKFLAQLGISLYIPEEDLEDCSICYQRGIGCKDEDRPYGVKAIRNRTDNGRCVLTLKCDKEWTLFDDDGDDNDACYQFFSDDSPMTFDDAKPFCEK